MSEKIWSDDAWEDYLYWQTQDKKTVKRINQLIKDIERNGCMEGIGKPDPLTGDLQGEYSRRINDKDRLVFIKNPPAYLEAKGRWYMSPQNRRHPILVFQSQCWQYSFQLSFYSPFPSFIVYHASNNHMPSTNKTIPFYPHIPPYVSGRLSRKSPQLIRSSRTASRSKEAVITPSSSLPKPATISPV